MAIEEKRAQYSISDSDEELVLTIPTKPKRSTTIWLSLWLVAWAAGALYPITGMTWRGLGMGEAIYSLVFFGMWYVGGAAAIFIWSWLVAGKEIIAVSSGQLWIRRESFGIGTQHGYPFDQIEHLRIPETGRPKRLSSSLQNWGASGGILVFNHGMQQVCFGSSLDDIGAKEALSELMKRLPASVAEEK